MLCHYPSCPLGGRGERGRQPISKHKAHHGYRSTWLINTILCAYVCKTHEYTQVRIFVHRDYQNWFLHFYQWETPRKSFVFLSACVALSTAEIEQMATGEGYYCKDAVRVQGKTTSVLKILAVVPSFYEFVGSTKLANTSPDSEPLVDLGLMWVLIILVIEMKQKIHSLIKSSLSSSARVSIPCIVAFTFSRLAPTQCPKFLENLVVEQKTHY